MESGSRRTIVAALGVNLGIAIAKGVGFLFTGSASMLAETMHSVADTGNQALLLWGSVAAEREPSAIHPIGYGRERYFWAFVVALILFSLGGLFAINLGVEKFRLADQLHNPELAIGIVLFGVLLEGYSFRTASAAARSLKRDSCGWEFIRYTKNPELPAVLREALESGPDVRTIIHMRTQQLGPDQLLVAAKVEFAATESFVELTHAIDRAESRIRSQPPRLNITIYLARAGHS